MSNSRDEQVQIGSSLKDGLIYPRTDLDEVVPGEGAARKLQQVGVLPMPPEERSSVRAAWFDFQFFSAGILERGSCHSLRQTAILKRLWHRGVVDNYFSIVQSVLKQAEHTAHVQFELLRGQIVLDLRGRNGVGFGHGKTWRKVMPT